MTQTQQIHKEFKEALNVSTLTLPQEPTQKSLYKELETIGAMNSKTFQKHQSIEMETSDIIKDKEAIEELRKMEVKYPNYRIIDYPSVMKLCKKYNLVVGQISNYKEMIPENNIGEMLHYKRTAGITIREDLKSINNTLYINRGRNSYEPKFLIAAPASFFKEGRVIDGFIIPIEEFKLDLTLKAPTLDPVVLQELLIPGNKKYFHIVSAWEIEAEDEMVSKEIPKNGSNN